MFVRFSAALCLFVVALPRHAAAEYEDEYVSESDITSGAEVVPESPASREVKPSTDKRTERVWISLGVQQELLVHQSSRPACGRRYTCFAGGSEYHGPIWSGYGNEVKSGLALATTRALFGLDIVIGKNFQLGTRLGYAFGGHPSPTGVQKFQPYHAELRVAYYYGKSAFTKAGVRPYWALGAGFAEVSSHVSVDFYRDAAAYNDGRQETLRAWRTTGRGFVAPTLGAQFAFLRGTAITLELRLLAMVGTPGIAPAGGISLTQGF